MHGIQKLFTLQNDQPRQLTFGKSIDVSPTVSNGKVVFVSDQGNMSRLYKLHSGGVKDYLPLEGVSMSTPMMYHHQLYWYDNTNRAVMVFDSVKKETSTFLTQKDVRAISPTPFGLLVATNEKIMLVDFEGNLLIKKPIIVNILSTSWMDVT